jgi:hypothetical protein
MFSLFSTVGAFLFFLGFSLGVSVTSTTIISRLSSAFKSCFFPGNLNSLALIKISSTFLTIRKTVDSLIPQLCPI